MGSPADWLQWLSAAVSLHLQASKQTIKRLQVLISLYFTCKHAYIGCYYWKPTRGSSKAALGLCMPKNALPRAAMGEFEWRNSECKTGS